VTQFFIDGRDYMPHYTSQLLVQKLLKADGYITGSSYAFDGAREMLIRAKLLKPYDVPTLEQLTPALELFLDCE